MAERRRRKLRHRPRRRTGVGLLVCMVAGPHHRSGFDMAETEAQSLVSQICKLIRLVETGDGHVILRRTQVLADGENVDATCTEVAENFDQFFR